IIIPIAVTFGTRTSGTATTTTVTAPVFLAYWAFENNANDVYGNYSGSITGSSTYQGSGIFGGTPYYIYGSSGYMQVASPYFNLNSRSFTFEIWIYPLSITNDQPIFSQCTCTTCTSQCLFLMIRSGKLYMGFNFNDLTGSTTLSASGIWYHVAFVYNYLTSQQIIYLDGVQDAVRSSVTTPYLGTNGTMYFGYSQISSSNYFYGYMDNAQLTTRAKTSAEILVDGSQIFYYSFDQPNPYYDNSPNGLNATTTQNVISTSGHVGQAVRFTTTSSSYIQLSYWPYTGWPTSNSFSFAMWIYPTSINNGVLIYTPNNGLTLLGLTYNGQIILQLNQGSPSNVWLCVIGPFILVNTWTQ
ncbi:unnamed protein product, partial [Didymodactylos carnosus]